MWSSCGTQIRLTHNISLAIKREGEPPPADPVADAVFDAIDANGDGEIDAKELVQVRSRA